MCKDIERGLGFGKRELRKGNPSFKKQRVGFKCGEVQLKDTLAGAYSQAVEPELSVSNAVDRWILVPGVEFGNTEIGGWLGQIKKIDKRTQVVDVKMSDGKKHWKLSYIVANFKVVSK